MPRNHPHGDVNEALLAAGDLGPRSEVHARSTMVKYLGQVGQPRLGTRYPKVSFVGNRSHVHGVFGTGCSFPS